jgi:aminodeoxyfutalosine deaminase
MAPLSQHIASLSKAELHLHLEGSIQPPTVCALTARHGLPLSQKEVRERYVYRDFNHFIETFKWVTSFLREPKDYALIANDLAEHLLTQNVVYTEVTLSIGVMLLRKQKPEANFEAILEAVEPFKARGLRFNWVFDAVRQFGPDAAMEVLEAARRSGIGKIIAFGIGGDELSLPTEDFRGVYQRAGELGLRRLMHAGEIGGPEIIRESIEILGAERIGHGIAAINDPALMDLLAERQITLEVCPGSNLLTGALARQLRRKKATIEEHPLPQLLRHGIPIVLSTDDPAMFHTTLVQEYENAAAMGLSDAELASLVEMGFRQSFRPEQARPA